MADLPVLKIALVGPPQSGKSRVANYLFDPNTAAAQYTYEPTVGVRILEFERKIVPSRNQEQKVQVELWDVSGDLKYESCWPCIRKDMHGSIVLFDSISQVQEKELET
eukprot:TRINITY_DN5641_c0_g1_i3.p1 TRINITY_DN5641_c0_g1~~TRINITY_DN5641_c0_g1_i3.p1  ORF type:complete len:108 (-),score=9.53 TRINITY_DN5641_c0_g1_i3:414-737(-)